jgi:hypothetical protein
LENGADFLKNNIFIGYETMYIDYSRCPTQKVAFEELGGDRERLKSGGTITMGEGHTYLIEYTNKPDGGGCFNVKRENPATTPWGQFKQGVSDAWDTSRLQQTRDFLNSDKSLPEVYVDAMLPAAFSVSKPIKQKEVKEVLPKSLQVISDAHWNLMGDAVLDKVAGFKSDSILSRGSMGKPEQKDAIHRLVDKICYEEIYEKFSRGKVDYIPTHSSKESCDKEWANFGANQKYGSQYSQSESTLGQHYLARVDYVKDVTISGLQCVVTSGAGIPLFREVGDAIDAYIDDKCDGDPSKCPIAYFKVVKEYDQIDRSESVVFYLSTNYDHPSIIDFVENYLNPRIQHKTADLDLIGMRRVGESNIFGAMSHPIHSCRGDLIAKALGTAYVRAFEEGECKPVPRNILNARAKVHLAQIWHELKMQ